MTRNAIVPKMARKIQARVKDGSRSIMNPVNVVHMELNPNPIVK
jgi:hypothetical protein